MMLNGGRTTFIHKCYKSKGNRNEQLPHVNTREFKQTVKRVHRPRSRAAVDSPARYNKLEKWTQQVHGRELVTLMTGSPALNCCSPQMRNGSQTGSGDLCDLAQECLPHKEQ